MLPSVTAWTWEGERCWDVEIREMGNKYDRKEGRRSRYKRDKGTEE
jgi:hypothetical protein